MAAEAAERRSRQARPAKFTAYSMDPENPRNRGKWKTWGEVGYDVHNACEQAADDVIRQIECQLSGTPNRGGKRTGVPPRGF